MVDQYYFLGFIMLLGITLDGEHIYHKLGGSLPPFFDGMQIGLRNYFCICGDWYVWVGAGSHGSIEFKGAIKSGIFYAYELMEFAGEDLEVSQLQ